MTQSKNQTNSGVQTWEKAVLILGATSDIALALAKTFAAEGRPLYLACRQPDKLSEAQKDLEVRYQVPVQRMFFDVLEIDKFDDFFNQFDLFPEVVISAVGLMGEQGISQEDTALANQVMHSNFNGPSLALEVAASGLLAREKPGWIIGISSVAGDRGRAANYIYGAAKAGFSAYLSGLRQRLNRTPVQVMTVKPGFVATRMTEGMDLPATLTNTPEDIAALVLKAMRKNRSIVCPWKWWIIMTIIKLLPEAIFKRLKF